MVTAGAILDHVPVALVDPLGTLTLTPSQFLVPIDAKNATSLDFWQFSLWFDAAVAAPADVGGLFQSVYQADFGSGEISQITGSGFNFGDLLDGVSGWFSPAVGGDGVIAYVLFQYLPGQEGMDPSVSTEEPSSPSTVPEPGALLLALTAGALVVLVGHIRRQGRDVFSNASIKE